MDPNKTFATGEVKFAHMWYTRASQEMKDKFKKLVKMVKSISVWEVGLKMMKVLQTMRILSAVSN